MASSRLNKILEQAGCPHKFSVNENFVQTMFIVIDWFIEKIDEQQKTIEFQRELINKKTTRCLSESDEQEYHYDFDPRRSL